jgi:thioredoxin reductase
MKDNYDVIIIGGSYAGLSAALSLGRALRNVLVIDNGKPCNRFTPHSHNFLTHDGEKPADIADRGKTDLRLYKTVAFQEDTAIKATNTNNGFTIQTASGSAFHTRKLIIASGLKDIMPDIDGLEACWGKSVIHCPYCHGYEFAHEATGIIANGEGGFHYAEMIHNWTKDLTLFTNGPSSLTSEQLEKIRKNNIKIIETPIDAIQHEKGQVHGVQTKDGQSFPVKAVYHKAVSNQHSDIPEKLGCELTEPGLIKVDEFRETTIKGVFACGDNSSFRSVATAVYTGSITGVMVNKALTEEGY